MITKISTIESHSNNPYYNLSLEKHLFDTVQDGEMILYLWQNRRTVVCGRNQNMYKECRVSRLLEDGGFPVRRLSGGGAVFHDLGNLNFTFLVKDADYDVEKQLSVILEACLKLGINAEKTGRNDITVEGRKFSGNAFYSSNGRRYHHGTIMISVDKETLSEYLNVDKAKLASKGVESVRSRVANLTEFLPELTVSGMKEAMWASFEKVYGLSSDSLKLPDESVLEESIKKFSSESWLYGIQGNFTMQITRRFDWGDFDLHINSAGSVIKEAVIYSDAIDADYIAKLSETFGGTALTASELGGIADKYAATDEQRRIALDIRSLLLEQL
jgi:lipoyltransferase and lipoate-protein ligase